MYFPQRSQVPGQCPGSVALREPLLGDQNFQMKTKRCTVARFLPLFFWLLSPDTQRDLRNSSANLQSHAGSNWPTAVKQRPLLYEAFSQISSKHLLWARLCGLSACRKWHSIWTSGAVYLSFRVQSSKVMERSSYWQKRKEREWDTWAATCVWKSLDPVPFQMSINSPFFFLVFRFINGRAGWFRK